MDAKRRQVAENLLFLERRWAGAILLCLMDGEQRFRAIAEALGITDAVLSTRLKELEDEGLVTRRQQNARPPQVWYMISKRAAGLRAVFDALAKWKR